jgi:acyl-CoA thioester hydrolase
MTVSPAPIARPPQARSFHWPVRVYWEDTDAGGIVFYANYLKYFERARTEWLRQSGLEQQQLRSQFEGMFVVSECQLRYLLPARLDDALDISVQTLEVGRASLLLQQQACLQRPGQAAELLCSGAVRLGWVHGQTLRPARLPGLILDTLGLRTAPVASAPPS